MLVDIKEKYYGSKLKLKNIRINFEPGQTSLILGTSGAGKSTLIKCITGQTKFEGTIRGCDKSEIAYIPQFPALNMNETVYESIFWSARFAYLFEKTSKLHDKTKYWVKQVGLNNESKQKIKDLSGGQKQRVSIARELIRGKRVIIADEIDTGLDGGVAKKLIEILIDVTHKKKLKTIVISHNLMNVELYDKAVVLVKDNNHDGTGRLVYSGNAKCMLSYFGVSNYVDMLVKLNRRDELGLGEAGQYFLN